MDGSTPTVRRDDERSRYELMIEGSVVGFADFHLDGDLVIMPHTVIDPARRGQGLAATLVQAALDDVRERGRSVVPSCWYVAQFLDEHPEYADLRAA